MDGRANQRIPCRNCGATDHWPSSPKCPKGKGKGKGVGTSPPPNFWANMLNLAQQFYWGPSPDIQIYWNETGTNPTENQTVYEIDSGAAPALNDVTLFNGMTTDSNALTFPTWHKMGEKWKEVEDASQPGKGKEETKPPDATYVTVTSTGSASSNFNPTPNSAATQTQKPSPQATVPEEKPDMEQDNATPVKEEQPPNEGKPDVNDGVGDPWAGKKLPVKPPPIETEDDPATKPGGIWGAFKGLFQSTAPVKETAPKKDHPKAPDTYTEAREYDCPGCTKQRPKKSDEHTYGINCQYDFDFDIKSLNPEFKKPRPPPNVVIERSREIFIGEVERQPPLDSEDQRILQSLIRAPAGARAPVVQNTTGPS